MILLAIQTAPLHAGQHGWRTIASDMYASKRKGPLLVALSDMGIPGLKRTDTVQLRPSAHGKTNVELIIGRKRVASMSVAGELLYGTDRPDVYTRDGSGFLVFGKERDGGVYDDAILVDGVHHTLKPLKSFSNGRVLDFVRSGVIYEHKPSVAGHWTQTSWRWNKSKHAFVSVATKTVSEIPEALAAKTASR